MRISRFGLLLLAAASVGLAGCDRGDVAEAAAEGSLRGKLTLTGSSTVAPLVGEIAKRFETQHPDVRIDVQTGGSSRRCDGTGGAVVALTTTKGPLT